MRRIISQDDVRDIYDTLRSRVTLSKQTWNRKILDYESKIRSGNVLHIAEVIRDLHVKKRERSYTEKDIYESAIKRLADEVSHVENIDHSDAVSKLMEETVAGDVSKSKRPSS